MHIVGYNVTLANRGETVSCKIKTCDPINPVFSGTSMRAEGFVGVVKVRPGTGGTYDIYCHLETAGRKFLYSATTGYYALCSEYKGDELNKIMRAVESCFSSECLGKLGL